VSTTIGCAEAKQALGVLVLGALDPAERDAVEAHVAACPGCAAALAEIAPMAGLLHRVRLEGGPPLPQADPPAPPALVDRALARIRFEERRDRRRRWVVVAAAAACLAVLLGGIVVRVHGSSTAAPVLASGTSATTSVWARVLMTPTDSGTTLDLTLGGVRPGEHCQIVAVSHTGVTDVAASWVAAYDGEAEITGATWLTLNDIQSLRVTSPDRGTLLEVPVPA
jgi:hypothetical protein